MLFIFSIVCLIFGIVWVVTVLLRSALDFGYGTNAPQNQTGIEKCGGMAHLCQKEGAREPEP